MRASLLLLTLLLAACQHPDAVKERVPQSAGEAAPERNLLMANVVIWWAHGNEPFWKFTADSGKLRFESLGEEAEYFAYTPFDNDGTARTFKAKNERTSIQIRMLQQTCTDNMSGAQYPWTAEVTVGKRKLQGCGERGRLME
ncbi:hypothetical protein D3C72_99820 [compost metagenome]